jgi:hypothetical protein
MLAVWDWLFGSLHFSETGKKIRFGLRPNEASATNIILIYLKPFIEVSNIFKSTYKKLLSLMGLNPLRLKIKNDPFRSPRIK